MSNADRTRIRQRRITGLALVVVAIWVGFVLDPMLRPVLMGGLGVALGGLLLLGGGMLLGALGFALVWGFGRSQNQERTASELRTDFSDEIPPAKPSGPPRWVRWFLPLLVLFLLVVMGLSMAGDPAGLLRLIFGGLLLCFGLFVVVILLSGITLATARAVREATQRFSGPVDTPQG